MKKHPKPVKGGALNIVLSDILRTSISAEIPANAARVPFSHSDWIYEIKWDGFRALAYVEKGVCRLVSRNGNVFKSFPALASGLPDKLRAGAAVLDGEIVCIDSDGKSRFSPYIPDCEPRWLKIRNTDYSQWAGREELFERERANDPDTGVWNDCVLACAAADVLE